MSSKEALHLEASIQQPKDGNEDLYYNASNTLHYNSSASSSSWNKMDTTISSTSMESDILNHMKDSNIQTETRIAEDFEETLLRSQTRDEFSKLTSQQKRKRKTNRNNKYLDTEQEDDFFDVPITNPTHSSSSSSSIVMDLILAFGKRKSQQVYQKMYSDTIPMTEFIRTLCLSITLFFMVGGYWILRSVKDPVFSALCGVEYIPKAKILSMCIVLGIVSIYNRLLDIPHIMKHTLFYYFGTFYFLLFSTISYLLTHPTIGLRNEIPNTHRFLGWISFCAIESFGSVMVALFWSFTNSNFPLESAKASYGLLTAIAQLGSILGPTLVNIYATRIGVAFCYAMGACCIIFLQGSMYIYVCMYGTCETRAPKLIPATTTMAHTPSTLTSTQQPSQTTNTSKGSWNKSRSQKAGIFEGLYLFVKYNYVKGLFAISCLFMIEMTIIDYTLKVLARDHFATIFPCQETSSCWDASINAPMGMSLHATEAFTKFMGLFGQATNILSFILSFFGTSLVIRKFGLRWTLLLFPSLCLVNIIIIRMYPTLYVVFTAMIILKACTYALNNPTKEILYQPTSSAVKYKAKSWIDIFGARGSSALGSVVTNAFSDSTASLIHNGSLVGMLVTGVLVWNARFMGEKFDEYISSSHIVGDDDGMSDDYGEAEAVSVSTNESPSDFSSTHALEMAMIPNRPTSCAIYEDDDEVGEVSDEKIDTNINSTDVNVTAMHKIEFV